MSEINHRKIYHRTSSHRSQHRVEVERHGAIQLGLASELSMIRRLIAVMGMEPVGYFDLTVAGLPVHATGFRPTTTEALQRNPFRVFISLLRLDLIQDKALREQARAILEARDIFTPRCIELIEQFEAHQIVTKEMAQEFIKEALETFRWHETSTVDMDAYKRLEFSHPLVADVTCFKVPHINHLTPRVLDIDAAQEAMKDHGLRVKTLIEDPPPREHLILLRQTSFLALEEEISFSNGAEKGGKHRVRFGEIEQRGMALTPKGRRLYDELLAKAKSQQVAAERPEDFENILTNAFIEFPCDLGTLRQEQLAFFRYFVKDPVQVSYETTDFDSMVSTGILGFEPITYEDFLPASAAGIFNSNLNASSDASQGVSSDQEAFETALGRDILDPFKLYEKLERDSVAECLARLK